jgi:23S rRNA pseudouridine1911/1915/1917 synthase
VHPDGNTSKTLMNAVHNYLSKKVENTFAYPVHRIDFDTTGIVVFAKDPLTLSFLSTEIENHNLIKKYVCLCYNRFPSLSGKIEKNISKDRHSNKQIISKNGKEAISYYKVLENGSVSKVEVTIIHGRTHQIRVHMQSINHPLLGDKIYGKDDGYDLKLHFKNISFFHPFKGEKIFIECEEQF